MHRGRLGTLERENIKLKYRLLGVFLLNMGMAF